MFDEIKNLVLTVKNGLILLVRAIIKISAGFIVIPLGILVDKIKPEWEEAHVVVKVITGIIFLPVMGVMYVLGPWWDDFDVVD